MSNPEKRLLHLVKKERFPTMHIYINSSYYPIYSYIHISQYLKNTRVSIYIFSVSKGYTSVCGGYIFLTFIIIYTTFIHLKVSQKIPNFWSSPLNPCNPIYFNPLTFRDFGGNHVKGNPLKYFATR